MITALIDHHHSENLNILDLQSNRIQGMRIAWSERRGGILAEGEEEILDEIQEIGVGEDRQPIR